MSRWLRRKFWDLAFEMPLPGVSFDRQVRIRRAFLDRSERTFSAGGS